MINIIIESWTSLFLGPCFVDMSSVEVVWLVYKIMAISVHVGAQPKAGHYRGILIAEWHHWQTDDGKMAERLNAHDPILNSQSYMFWRMLDSVRPTGGMANAANSNSSMRSDRRNQFRTSTYTALEGAPRAGDTLHAPIWSSAAVQNGRSNQLGCTKYINVAVILDRSDAPVIVIHNLDLLLLIVVSSDRSRSNCNMCASKVPAHAESVSRKLARQLTHCCVSSE